MENNPMTNLFQKQFQSQFKYKLDEFEFISHAENPQEIGSVFNSQPNSDINEAHEQLRNYLSNAQHGTIYTTMAKHKTTNELYNIVEFGGVL